MQGERGTNQGNVLRKLDFWSPGYVWGMTKEGSVRAAWEQSPKAPVRSLDSGELGKFFKKEGSGSDLFCGQLPILGFTGKWLEEGQPWSGESGLEVL